MPSIWQVDALADELVDKGYFREMARDTFVKDALEVSRSGRMTKADFGYLIRMGAHRRYGMVDSQINRAFRELF